MSDKCIYWTSKRLWLVAISNPLSSHWLMISIHLTVKNNLNYFLLWSKRQLQPPERRYYFFIDILILRTIPLYLIEHINRKFNFCQRLIFSTTWYLLENTHPHEFNTHETYITIIYLPNTIFTCPIHDNMF